MPNRAAIIRAVLCCVLALAVLGFRAPAADLQPPAQQVAALGHDHHGHSHDDEAASPAGHDHDRLHLGDHSHETPSAAAAHAFRQHVSKRLSYRAPETPMTSLRPPPGERPPRLS